MAATPPSWHRQLLPGPGWDGAQAAWEGQRHFRSHTGSLSPPEQTFIYREEALAQDVAATSEFHPEPAVRGDEGLWDFVATKPTWEREKNCQALADSKEGAQHKQKERESRQCCFR